MTAVGKIKLSELRRRAPAKSAESDKVRNFRPSDFLTDEEQAEVKRSNSLGKRARRKFDAVDAYCAEILARFGWDAYLAWQTGQIPETKMGRLIWAERARDAGRRLPIEGVIYTSMAGANNPTKSKKAPKSLKIAMKMIKEEEKTAKGEA